MLELVRLGRWASKYNMIDNCQQFRVHRQRMLEVFTRKFDLQFTCILMCCFVQIYTVCSYVNIGDKTWNCGEVNQTKTTNWKLQKLVTFLCDLPQCMTDNDACSSLVTVFALLMIRESHDWHRCTKGSVVAQSYPRFQWRMLWLRM